MSKQGVALKKYRVHGNSWNGETLSKQGVALKNIGYTVIVWNGTSLQMFIEQTGTGCQNRIWLHEERTYWNWKVGIKCGNDDCIENVTQVNLYLLSPRSKIAELGIELVSATALLLEIGSRTNYLWSSNEHFRNRVTYQLPVIIKWLFQK